MAIDFPISPSTDQTYTYLTTTWKWNGFAWEKSAATETGNTEGTTGGVAYYSGKGSTIAGATAFFYGGAGVGIGTSGPTETLDVRGGITASGRLYASQGITSGGDIHLDGDIIMRNQGSIKVEGDTESIYMNAGGGQFTFSASAIDIKQKIRHMGDTDTLLEFTDGNLSLQADGNAFCVGTSTTGNIGGVTFAGGGATFGSNVTIRNAGDIALNLIADTDNSGEEDNPIIAMGQDGAEGHFTLGVVGSNGQIFTNSRSNAAYLNTKSTYNDLQFAVNDKMAMTILDTGEVGIGTNTPDETPGALLDVRGGITASHGLYAGGGATFGNDICMGGNYHFRNSAGESLIDFEGDRNISIGDNDSAGNDTLIYMRDSHSRITMEAGTNINLDSPAVYIPDALIHKGDTNTKLTFGTDSITLAAGGTDYQAITSAGTNFADTDVVRPNLKDYSETVNAIGTITGNTAVSFADGNVQTVTGNGDCEFTFTNPPASGKAGTLTMIITNGGANATTWHSSVKWPGDNAPALTSSGVDIVSFTTIDAGTTIYGFVGGINFS